MIRHIGSWSYFNGAFTLAEVLITLGVIGVVAALTMPALMANYKKMVLKNQFKKTYSVIYNAYRKAEADMGYPPQCFYWSKNPYASLGAACSSRDENGVCQRYTLGDGSPMPADYNGPTEDCYTLKKALLSNLNLVKSCEGNAYAGGCTPEYNGFDTILKAEDDDMSDYDIGVAISGCSAWSKNNLKTRSAYVLTDGQILISYNPTFFPMMFAVDINGKKGPNKWGHDVFPFDLGGEMGKSPKLRAGGCIKPEKGGMSTTEMIKYMSK